MISRNQGILTILLIFIGVLAIGQDNPVGGFPCLDNLPEEKTILETDRDYYLAGEKLWFKAYVFVDGQLNSDWSKVLYVELFNDNKNTFAQHKYQLSEGVTDGAIEIPADLNTGYYYLRAYTQYMRNFPSGWNFTKSITVVNPQSEVTRVKNFNQELERAVENPDDNLAEGDFIRLNILTSKLLFGQREQVELSIENKVDANLSVVVRKKGTAYSDRDLEQILEANPWLRDSYAALPVTYKKGQQKAKTVPESLEWIPEVRGLTLSGMIRNKNTLQPVPDIYCITSVIGNESQLHMSRTQKNGRFLFSYKHLQEDKNIFVAIRNNDSRDLEILVNSDFSTDFPESTPMAFSYDSTRHAFFEELYINKQLGQNFDLPFKQEAYPGPEALPPAFNIGSPDLVVNTQAYIDIPTLPEVFRELVPTVTIKGKIGSRKLNIFDKDAFKNYDNPLVMVDNVPVNDIEKFLQISPRQLKSIEVFNSQYLLGDYLFEGIVSVKTDTDDFGGFKWTDESVFLQYATLRPAEIFQHPVYQSAGDKATKKPDFRTLLYWNPQIHLKGNPETVTFFTSDHISEYEVVVQGFTTDGKPCYGSTIIEVVK